jgi:hypothetical protein
LKFKKVAIDEYDDVVEVEEHSVHATKAAAQKLLKNLQRK